MIWSQKNGRKNWSQVAGRRSQKTGRRSQVAKKWLKVAGRRLKKLAILDA
jgi:hypothetical protein